MKVKLFCRWSDYYDKWFDGDGYVWERQNEPNMDRATMMSRLLELGYMVPTHGIAASVIPKAIETYQTDNLYFIAHVDVNASGGEGKVLIGAKACLNQFPAVFVTQFLGNINARTYHSYRFLRVGHKAFGIKFSGSYWKADYSKDTTYKICCESVVDSYNDALPYVLYSIDYVLFNGQSYAVDFNNAPHVGSMDIQSKMSGSEAAAALKEGIEYFKNKGLNY